MSLFSIGSSVFNCNAAVNGWIIYYSAKPDVKERRCSRSPRMLVIGPVFLWIVRCVQALVFRRMSAVTAQRLRPEHLPSSSLPVVGSLHQACHAVLLHMIKHAWFSRLPSVVQWFFLAFAKTFGFCGNLK